MPAAKHRSRTNVIVSFVGLPAAPYGLFSEIHRSLAMNVWEAGSLRDAQESTPTRLCALRGRWQGSITLVSWAFLTATFFLAASAAIAQDPTLKPSIPHPIQDTYVRVIERLSGDPVLVVDYPWRRHAEPSIEVRSLNEDEVGKRLIYPLYFRNRIMRDTVTVALYRAQDAAEDRPTTTQFTRDGIEFQVFADYNSLGNVSTSVAGRTETVSLDKSQRSARAAFPVLDQWALNERALYLEVPISHFPKPCKIRVWLLRDENIIWAEDVDWPGFPNALEANDGS
jgi:hypothetical protein